MESLKDTALAFGEKSGHGLELHEERPSDAECSVCSTPQQPTRWPGSDKWIVPPEVCGECETESYWRDMMSDRIAEEWQCSGLATEGTEAELRRHDVELPKVLERLILMPREHDFQACAVYIWGPPGTGKTLMCAKLAKRYLEHWMAERCRPDTTVRYINVKDAIKRDKESWSGDKPPVDWDAIREADLTILDDLAREAATNHNAGVIDDLIEQRYQLRLPTVFVSNKDLDDLTPTRNPSGKVVAGHPNYDERLVGRMSQMIGIQTGKTLKIHKTKQYRTYRGGK